MPQRRTEWAHPAIHPDPHPVYHWVTFEPGPTTRQEATAACGLTGRYYPKIGIRTNDEHCRACIDACAAAW